MSTKSSNTSSGVGLGTIIVVILFILKVAGLISISWIWVFAGWWIPIILILVIALIAALLT